MADQLSPYRLGKARDIYNLHNIFNSLSWNLLVGSIITLLAMRLGASSTYIGLLAALGYISLFFMPLGKFLSRFFKIIKIFSIGWISRSLMMLLAVAAPLAYYAGDPKRALLLIMLGIIGFQFCRGFGMVGNNPVLSQLAAGPDRGSYITQTQVVNSAVTMFGSFLVAIVLGREPPMYLYSLILSVGVVCGVIGGVLLGKVPEPPKQESQERMGFFSTFKYALTQESLRRFITILFIVAMVSGVSRTFLVVYVREVFGHNDGMISLYTVFGGLGFLMIGLLIKFLVDRIGAKPIFIMCVIIGMASMIPIVFFPQSAIENMSTAILFLAFLFFMMNFGFLGSEGIAQTYFMGLVPEKMMLDMSIVYFIVFGIAGAVGSTLAGLFLDLLSTLNLSSFISFKILFSLLITLSFVAVMLQRNLVRLGALPFMGALEVMFSYRDLRAITLLDKLNKTHDSQEEKVLLGALHDTPSQLAVKGLLERARSPRLATRLEALRAMEALQTLDDDTEKALMDEIITNTFTTAYISARILGNRGCFAAIPILRELSSSQDYMLAGEAMIALAKLNDVTFRPQIEKIVSQSQNPRLKIMGVEAFGIYTSSDSLPALFDIMREDNPPPYLRDAIVLSMSRILDTPIQFYRILLRYLQDQTLLRTLVRDEVEASLEFYHSNMRGKQRSKKTEAALIARHAKSMDAVISAYIDDKNGEPLSRWIQELPGNICNAPVCTIISEAVMNEELMTHDRLRLLLIHWATYQLRIWTKKIRTII